MTAPELCARLILGRHHSPSLSTPGGAILSSERQRGPRHPAPQAVTPPRPPWRQGTTSSFAHFYGYMMRISSVRGPAGTPSKRRVPAPLPLWGAAAPLNPGPCPGRSRCSRSSPRCGGPDRCGRADVRWRTSPAGRHRLMDGPGAGRGAEAGMTHWRPCMLPRAHGALGARPGGLSPGSPTTSASAIRGSHGGPPWSTAVANTARPRAGGGVDGARAGHAGGRGELAEMPETQLRVDSPSLQGPSREPGHL